MEAVTHRVGEINTADREALEHLVGRALHADQQVVIRVVENAASHKIPLSATTDDVPDWWKIYDGLSDEEIEQLDQAIRRRADLTRAVQQLMDVALLDTDILSEIVKLRNMNVRQHALVYAAQNGQLAFSAMTRYEVIRGYREQNAAVQLQRFETFCQRSIVYPITDSIFDLAADLWVAARRGGHPGGDADLIIAATALEHGRTLITGNISHFAWIAALKIEDWRNP